MQTAAAYIRVSTDDQIEYSPDSQLKAIREYAKRNDFILPEEFIFVDEGISGRKADKRPAFMKMIAAAKIKPKPFDSILLWKFSRFARNREDSIVYKSMLRKQCGINVISISEQLSEDKTAILIEALLEAMDEYYSINLAEEVKRGMAEKAGRGEVVSAPPYGYEVKDNIFVINPDTCSIVKLIYDDFINGKGCSTIARELNLMGLKTKRGNNWENRTVEYILRNPVYTGKLRWTPTGQKDRYYDNPDTIIVNGKHEALIDLEQWEKAQEKLTKNKRAYPKYSRIDNNSDFMLRGLVKCSACGAALTRNIKAKSLQCSRYAHSQCSVSHSITLEKINEAIINELEKQCLLGAFNIELKINNSAVNNVSRELLGKEYKKLSRIREAYENGIDTLEEYKENKTKISEHIKQLENEIPKQNIINPEIQLKKKIENAIIELRNVNVSENEKNTILKSFISKIVFNKAKQKANIYFYI